MTEKGFSVGDRVRYIERIRSIPGFDKVGTIVAVGTSPRGVVTVKVDWDDDDQVPQLAAGTQVEELP